MRILLADDQGTVRSALRLLLEQQPEYLVAGEAADAVGLLQAIGDKVFDLILLDWELPGLAMSRLLAYLRYESPGTQVIAMSSRPEARGAALAAGVDQFVSKSAPPEQVISTLQAVNDHQPPRPKAT